MTKLELIRIVARRAGVTQEVARAIIEAALEATVEALANGEAVKMIEFGTMEVKQREARTRMDFRNKQPMLYPAHKVITFTPAKGLKRFINQAEQPEQMDLLALLEEGEDDADDDE